MTQYSTFHQILKRDYRTYHQEKITQKSKALDFCRGLAVIFMVFVHVLGIYAHPKVYASTFGSVIDFLGSPPAAPVFMVTMGILSMFSSKNSTLKAAVKRGGQLFLMGTLLSFFRTDIFMLSHVSPLEYAALWEVDILQFAGLAYICMGLIRYFFPKPIHWLYMCLGLLIISPYLWGI